MGMEPPGSNIDGGGDRPLFEGKVISVSLKEKEKKKKIPFSSKEEDNENNQGQLVKGLGFSYSRHGQRHTTPCQTTHWTTRQSRAAMCF